MSTPQQIPIMSFARWIWLRRYYLLLSVGITVVQFLVFKWLYPYPNFLPDSFSYLEAAIERRKVNVWPVGYSWFLVMLSFVTHAHWWLTFLQYVLLQAGILHFLFSIAYLLRPGKWIFRMMLLLGIVNPLVLHVSNFVSSDALFSALSLVWCTQLIWIVCTPSWKLLLSHALVLLLVFTLRYNAMYYPIVSIGIIVLKGMPIQMKGASVGIILLFLGAFIGYTQVQYEKETGMVQFSPFGGWQLANNALYAYAKVPANERVAEQFELTGLHRITNRHIDSLQRLAYRPDAKIGSYFLWDLKSPLRQFPNVWWRNDSGKNGFQRWVLSGPMYREYGQYLIKHYPGVFMRYYIWPNLVNFYVPDPEFLGSYNMGNDTVEEAAVTWFGWKSNKVKSNVSGSAIRINNYYSLMLALVNLFFVLSFVGFVVLPEFSANSTNIKMICCCVSIVWICNMGFSVLSAPVVLRYQVFPMLMTQTFMLRIGEYIIKLALSKNIVPVIK